MIGFYIDEHAQDQAFVSFGLNWLKLLSDGHLDKACACLDDPIYRGNVLWTPELILELVNQTFSPVTRFYDFHPEGPRFTDPYALEIRRDRAKPTEYDDRSGYWLDLDMPLNDEWSDLTAQFEFLKRANGYAAALRDLHVL